MPTSYFDQFYEMDPSAPPPSGTTLTPSYLEAIDQNSNDLINRFSNDSLDGSDITRSYPGDTITLNTGGSDFTITGITFYLADGRVFFTPTDGSTLDSATFVSSTWVSTQGSLDVGDLGPPCFASGTFILTDNGEIPVEDLKVGDFVQTLDNGLQPIQWRGWRTVSARREHAPIQFAPGSVGNDRELLLSQQHRLLVTGWKAELYFGQSEILVAAKFLVNGKDIVIKNDTMVTYHHLLFETHEIIFSNGARSESFHPGEQILEQDADLRAELVELFPELDSGESLANWRTARRTINRYQASVLS